MDNQMPKGNKSNKRYLLPESYNLLGKERKLMNDTFYITCNHLLL